MRDLFRLFFLISLLHLGALAASAADQDIGLAGLSGKEVERRFGAPDERRAGKDGKESWLYGKSVVLFRDGKVTAWSNAGEMSGRENLATVRRVNETQSLRHLWQNAWTPQPGPSSEKMLEELFNRLEKLPVNDEPQEGKPVEVTAEEKSS